MSKAKVEKSKGPVAAGGELFPKAPPGYRLATTEESMELLKSGMVIQNATQTLRRCDAEVRAAEAEAMEARRQLQEGRQLTKKLHEKLGIEGQENDILTLPTGAVAILVDKDKRDEALKAARGIPGKAPKLQKVSDGPPPAEEPTKEAAEGGK